MISTIARGKSPLFVSGGAGTGKSSLLRFIREQANPSLAVVAPTGVAALNVSGSTIHSFFRFPPSLLTEHEFKFSPSMQELCSKLSGIVIDEISMVRADLLDAIDTSLKMHLKSFHVPFGGLQVVFFGDTGQLPPVIADDTLRKHFASMYVSPFFFDSHALRFASMTHLRLTSVFRQTNADFADLLNRIRDASATTEDLRQLNSRVDRRANLKACEAIILTTTNRSATDTNRLRLDDLAEESRHYTATIHGQIKESSFPTERELRLKVSARVIMLQNNNPHWANGTIGTIIGFGKHNGEECVHVKLPSGSHWVPRFVWNVIRYCPNRAAAGLREEAVGTFCQFPMKLAWAITIHRSQGMTFDRAIIDLSHGVFDHGQLYVALSRCRSLEGLSLTAPIRPSDLKYHERVRWFEQQR